MSDTTPERKRKSDQLTTSQLARLDEACGRVRRAFNDFPYLVGSAGSGDNARPDWRDVDVRTILADDEFDRLFGYGPFWELFCLAVSVYLQEVTGLPVDYQVQRMTEANETHGGHRRNPLGGQRKFAGGGDATGR